MRLAIVLAFAATSVALLGCGNQDPKPGPTTASTAKATTPAGSSTTKPAAPGKTTGAGW